MRPDAGGDVHDREGSERAVVSGDRGAGRAPCVLASPERPGEAGEAGEDQPVSRAALHVFPGEAAQHAGWGWVAAGPLGVRVWVGDQRRQHPLPSGPADPGGGRRGGDAAGRAAPQICQRHAAQQPVCGAARQAGAADGPVRRQHRPARGLGGYLRAGGAGKAGRAVDKMIKK